MTIEKKLVPRFRTLAVGSLAAMSLAGCSILDPFAEAKEAVAHNMKDPGSTQFRELKMCASGSGVEGEYNSKNSYGAYEGFNSFIYVDRRLATIGGSGDWDSAARECWGKYYPRDNEIAEAGGSNDTDVALNTAAAVDGPAAPDPSIIGPVAPVSHAMDNDDVETDSVSAESFPDNGSGGE